MDDEREPPVGRRRATRGSARDRLRTAGAEMFGTATLDDLSSFATVGRLTHASGLSSGAVYSAFPTPPGIARTAPQAAMRDAYLSLDFADDRIVQEVISMFERTVSGPEGATRLLEALAEVVAVPIEAAVRDADRWEYSQMWIGAAVANNDPEVAHKLASYYTGLEALYTQLIDGMLQVTGRVAVGGVSAGDIARVVIASADGVALRMRLDPDVDRSLLTLMLLGAIASMTRRSDEADDVFAMRLTAVGDAALSAAQLETVAASVRRVEQRAGWHEVDLARIAAMSDVDEVSLVVAYPTRHHLAVIIWSDVVDQVVRRAGARAGRDVDGRIQELVADLAEVACARRSVVASLLTARLHSSTGFGTDADPVNDRVVAMLMALLPGGPGITAVAARTALDALLLGAAGSDATASELGAVLGVGLRSVRDWVEPTTATHGAT